MSAKHTRGPWEVIGERIQRSNGQQIAAMHKDSWQTRGELRANARLIAAAPELLGACDKAASAFETLEKWGKVPMHVVMLRYGINELRAALAKARGE